MWIKKEKRVCNSLLSNLEQTNLCVCPLNILDYTPLLLSHCSSTQLVDYHTYLPSWSEVNNSLPSFCKWGEWIQNTRKMSCSCSRCLLNISPLHIQYWAPSMSLCDSYLRVSILAGGSIVAILNNVWQATLYWMHFYTHKPNMDTHVIHVCFTETHWCARKHIVPGN